MPRLARPDGVELHWEEAGDGPAVLFVCACFSFPAVFEKLLAQLAEHHRVVSYDRRGTGASTRRGPYEPGIDEDDLEAMLEEVGSAVVIPLGDACNRAVRVGARRPDLVRAVVTPGGNPLARATLGASEGLAASASVLEALVEMLRTDYRAALRSTTASTNPQMDEDAVRRRVDAMAEYAPQDVTLARLRTWIEDETEEEARAVGDRLWLLHHPHNPWFPLDIVEPTRRALPQAHVEVVEDGPLSRPDITARVIRALTSAAPRAAG